MLSIAERHKYILDELAKNGFVRVTDIARALGMTKVTIRNDLKVLENKGHLFRVHGSATAANPHVGDRSIKLKGLLNTESKQRIGEKAAGYIIENDSIILGSGSTVNAFAGSIKPAGHLNVVSLSLKASILLCEDPDIDVIQLGGNVNNNSFSVRGDLPLCGLNNLVCSKFFLGVDGIDLEFGITASTVEEATLTQELMKRASQTIVLADSSKFGKRGFGRISCLEDIDTIITDEGIPQNHIDSIEEAGVALVIV